MQQRSLETRNSILNAAIAQFMQFGYEVTSVSQICRAAGVSKGAFYHHFPSKQALFQQAMDEWLDSIDQQLDLTRQQDLTVPESLIEMGKTLPQVYQAAGGFLPMFLEFWLHAFREPELLDSVISPHSRYHRYFLAMMQEGLDEGSIQGTDPDTAARVLVSLAIGLLLGGLADPDAADWPQVAQEGIHLIVKGLEGA